MNRFKNKDINDKILNYSLRFKSQQTPIFFIHIPKTAGTSFWKSMSRNFKEYDLFPNNKIIQENNGSYPSLESIRLKKYNEHYQGVKFFYGHYPYFSRKLFGRNEFTWITFLRNPIDRTMSHLRHVKMHNSKYTNHSLSEIFHSPELRRSQFDNLQTRYLMSKAKANFIDKNDFEDVINNIQKIAIIGLSERFEESINKIEKLIGVDLSKLNENVFMNKLDVNLSSQYYADEKLKKEIIEANKFDQLLYDIVYGDFH